MNNRRNLLIVLGTAPLMPRAVLAQSRKQPVVIGWLGAFPRDAVARRFVAFKEGMAALGWNEGADYIIEDRWLEGGYERLQSLAQDLANKKPAVIVAAPPQAVTAAAEAAPNTPIVTAGGNPASMRLVSNFAWADKAEDIELAVTGLAKEGAQALIAGPSPFFTSERERIVRLALTHGLPVAGGASDWAEAGALFAYAADGEALWRRAAYYVDRILKGAKPGDLPIEQPMTFELVVNLKTAKALGLTMPPEILVRATRVIQ